MNLSTQTTLIAKLIGYVILVGAAIATMIPLLWLVTSSFKTANELFAVPLKWFPEAPPNVKSSPYIDQDAYPPIRKPDTLEQSVWADLQPQISALIWKEAQKHIAANNRMENYDRELNAELQNEMVEGLWKQLIAGLPGEVWEGSTAEILEMIRPAIISETIDSLWDSLYYEVALGSIQIEDTNFNHISVGMSKWEGASENVKSLREFTGNSNGTRLSYHFNQDNRAQIATLIRFPIPINLIRLISIPVRGDCVLSPSTLNHRGGRHHLPFKSIVCIERFTLAEIRLATSWTDRAVRIRSDHDVA